MTRIYRNFDLYLQVNGSNDPQQVLLQRAVPAIQSSLVTIATNQAQGFARLDNRMDSFEQSLKDIQSGKAAVTVHVNWGNRQSTTLIQGDDNSTVTTQTSAPSSSLPASTGATTTTSESSSSAATNSSIYKLSRGLRTLDDLWREWHVGLGAGGHSVVFLDEHHPGWSKNDHTFYSRRKRIITRIKKYAQENGMTEEMALRKAEDVRKIANFSIDHLSKNVKDIFNE